MAEFATIADMQARFDEQDLIQLTDGEGAIDMAKLETKLVSASNLVRGYVAGHYDTSKFASVPPLLVDLACEIAHAKLYHHGLPEQVKVRHDDAIKRLVEISRGTLKLDEGSAPLEQRGGAILIEGEERRFSRSSMEGF